MDRFPNATALKHDQPLVPQIVSQLQQMKKATFIRYEMDQFTHLTKGEKQVSRNFIAVEQLPNGEWTIYDNVSIHEQHRRTFSSVELVSEYVANLLLQPTKLDYLQARSAGEYGVKLNDDVLILHNNKEIKAKIIGQREAYPYQAKDDGSSSVLYYIPYKKDGTLSNVSPRIIHADLKVIPINPPQTPKNKQKVEENNINILKENSFQYRIGRMYAPINIKKMTDKRGYLFEHKYKSNKVGIYHFNQEIHLYYEKGKESIRVELSDINIPIIAKGNFKRKNNQHVIQDAPKVALKTLRKLERPGTLYQGSRTKLQSKSGKLLIEMPIVSEKEPEKEELLRIHLEVGFENNEDCLICEFESTTPIELMSTNKIQITS